MKSRVVITEWVHPEVIELLKKECDVVPNDTRHSLPREEILHRAKNAQAIMVFMNDLIDEDFLYHCPDLKVISATFTGYDNFDIDACARKRIWFTTVPDLVTVSTAELAIGLIIGFGHHMLQGTASSGATNSPVGGRSCMGQASLDGRSASKAWAPWDKPSLNV